MTFLIVSLIFLLIGGIALVVKVLWSDPLPAGASEAEKRLKTLGRNARCFCGSGKKYKACHRDSDGEEKTLADAQAAHDAVAIGNEPLNEREVARRGFSRWSGSVRRDPPVEGPH